MDAARREKRYGVRRLSEARHPVFGGAERDPVWDEAEELTDFGFPWTDGVAPATRFRALWDERRFVFRFEVEDGDLVLEGSGDGKARVLGSDRVELFFACDERLERYYCAEMDPRGGVYDYAGKYYREFDATWCWPGLEVAAEMAGGGYVVEGSLPMNSLKELGILAAGEQSMRVGVYRAEFSHGVGGVIEDWVSWVDPGTERPDFHVPESFGEFVFEG